MNYDKLIHIATYAGKVMLENGAEIYRVEDTINRICSAYGAKMTDSFATPTGIMVSIYSGNEVSSVIKRIKTNTVNLNKVAKINDLSRQIQIKLITLDELYYDIKKIEAEKPYRNRLVIPFASLTAASFSLMFGGNFNDFLVTLLSGFIIKTLQVIFNRHSINGFFTNYICGALATLISIFFYNINFISTIHFSVIGTIMLLVPGLAITNATRDIIAGDFLAGITKAAEAFLVAIAIAAGSGSILSLFINTVGGLSI